MQAGGVVCERDPDLFFPDDLIGEAKTTAESLAIAICKDCPVKKLCADYAIRAGVEFGVWGGTLPHERN